MPDLFILDIQIIYLFHLPSAVELERDISCPDLFDPPTCYLFPECVPFMHWWTVLTTFFIQISREVAHTYIKGQPTNPPRPRQLILGMPQGPNTIPALRCRKRAGSDKAGFDCTALLADLLFTRQTQPFINDAGNLFLDV